MGEFADKSAAGWENRRLDEFFAPIPEALTRPLTLLCLMAALNALVQPYRFDHDAQLYAAQVFARLHPGTLDQDLYLTYGSQDRFTLFSPTVGPLVSLLGLDAGFFLGYLISKWLLFWAMIRLVSALVEAPAARLLSLLYLALAPLPFGGFGIITVNECFLTPRILACGLVLLALERMLADRLLVSALLLVAAVLFHPLMAVGGLLIFAGWLGYRFLGMRGLLVATAVGALVAGVVLGLEPLGRRVFGWMDEEWRRIALTTSYPIIPHSWPLADWWRIGWAFAVSGITALRWPDRRGAFVAIVLGAGIAGLVGSEIAVHTHYLLLIQVSPFRALWLVEFLLIPLSLAWAVFLWQQGTDRARCQALAILFLVPANPQVVPLPVVIVAAALLLPLAVLQRGLGKQPHDPRWLMRCTGQSFVVGTGLLLLYDVGITVYFLSISMRPAEAAGLHPLLAVAAVPRVWYRLPLLLAAVRLARKAATLGLIAVSRLPLLAGWVGYQAFLFFTPLADGYRREWVADDREIQFVRAFLEKRAGPESRMFTVYWRRDPRCVWFQVGARCYFTGHYQMGGTSFNRQTAVEGIRRLERVRNFEAEFLKRDDRQHSEWVRHYLAAKEPLSPPTAADLRKLCEEPVVDFAILEDRFDGLYCATDGRLYIYDCRELRSHAPARDGTIPR